jgi:hypothetical protein
MAFKRFGEIEPALDQENSKPETRNQKPEEAVLVSGFWFLVWIRSGGRQQAATTGSVFSRGLMIAADQ